MIYQHWQGELKLKGKAAVGSGSKTLKDVDSWLPSKTPAGTAPDPANMQSLGKEQHSGLEFFPNMLHIGGGLTRIDFSITFTGTVEYWKEK